MEDQEGDERNTRFDSPIVEVVRESRENSNGGVFHLIFVSEVLTSTSLI
jgi:hypothetical protein